MSKNESENENETLTGFEIAIIGMSGRFPGARNITEFWNNLVAGRETISFFSDEELVAAGVSVEVLENPNEVKAFGIVENIEYFDPVFFGYSPADARQMDPQVRLFHEQAWLALEDAGYDSGSFQGLIGLYAGASDNCYWQELSYISVAGDSSDFFSKMTLNNKDFLSTRTSFKLNLKGPSSTISNACSTSLIAAHLACQSLLSGDCDMALAGGVALSIPQEKTYYSQEGMIYSPDGHCRTFDANARGSVFGNGIGVVVLKRLSEAMEDNDHIYAVIKGTAINNDGSRKIGYTAPSIEGQSEVIAAALQIAGLEAETIGFIEAHGTATPLGDSIEIAALKRAFNTSKQGFCALGTVKTNLGHLDAAAGVTGLIKAALALKNRKIPASLHFQSPNPENDIEHSPFYVNTGLKEWQNGHYPLRAGVSAFGIGGTNAHVILEEWPENSSPPAQRSHCLLLLSARSQAALDRMTRNLAEYFKENPGIHLADAAYTLQIGRKAFNWRRMLVCATVNEAVEKISSPDTGNFFTFCAPPDERSIVFMFSGLGAQYVNMGRELYETEILFRREVDRCFEILASLVDYDIKEILYPPETSNVSNIDQLEIAQLMVFIIQYALARLLMSWGIRPRSMIGYSFGEYAAACIAGVFSLEHALMLLAVRGELIKKTAPGAMLSVPLDRKALNPRLPGDLSLAIDNGPSCVVAGSLKAISEFEQQLKQDKIVSMRIRASAAVHSLLMEPVLEEFREKVKEVTLNEPRIPFISNVTGKWITADEAVDPGYWVRHLRETVQFDQGFNRLAAGEPRGIFIEIGPGRDLVVLARRHPGQETPQQAVHLLPPAQKKTVDVEYLLRKIGTLWLYGQAIDWPGFYGEEKRQRISLPGYSFDYQYCWLEIPGQEEPPPPPPLHAIKKPDPGDWFYLPQWNRCQRPSRKSLPTAGWLVFTDNCGIGDSLVKTRLNKHPQVIIVRKGTSYEKIETKEFVMNPASPGDYIDLLGDIKTLDLEPGLFQVLHLWSIEPLPEEGECDTCSSESVKRDLDLGYYSLVYLMQALEEQDLYIPLCLTVVSANMQEVIEENRLFPGKMPLLGAVKVIPLEYPNIRTRSIDIVIPPGGGNQDNREYRNRLLVQLWEEISLEISDSVVAFRGGHRWAQDFEPVYLREAPAEKPVLKAGGVYLISGGLGDVGFLLARHLARSVNARLVLLGRTPLPEPGQRDRWLDSHDEKDPVSFKIKKVRELEESGARVLVMSADVSDYEQMKAVIIHTESVFGAINGLIHSAGTVDPLAFHPLRELDRQKCDVHFKPKIYGTLVLEKLLRGKNLDFCLLMSSISGILGGVGFAAYSAANLFLDAFLQKQMVNGSFPWICVNWDHWEPGEDVDPAKISRARRQQLSMTPEEGTGAFERVLYRLGAGYPGHLVHSLADLHEKIKVVTGITGSTIMEPQEEPKNETEQIEQIDSLAPRPQLSSPYKAPDNHIQQTLVQIWQVFFGIREIGIEDDFFELGGDSLKAISVTSRIHKELDVDIPVREFFDHPTIRELAECIEGAETGTFTSIEPVEKKEYYECSSAQMRLYILDQLEPENIHYNNPMVMPLEGEIRQDRFEADFIRLILRHESFRTLFAVIEERPIQKIHDRVDFSLEYYDAGEEEFKGIIRDFTRPFDLGRAPLFRVGLIKVENRKHVLMIDVHHIIADGISLRIITRDFFALYGEEKLAPLKIQYKDFSEWQDNGEKEKLKKQEEFWLGEFQGEIPVLQLPIDYERPAIQGFEGDILHFPIPEQEIRRLDRWASGQGATLFMALLSIFTIVLGKVSGQEDIVVGSPTAGRGHPDLTHIIGMFVNTLALRNYPAGEKTFAGFLKEVKEGTLSAFDNQSYPFEDLVDRVTVNRDTARNPLFDVMFALHNEEVPQGNKSGQRVASEQKDKSGLNPYQYEHMVSRFDLTLHGDGSGYDILFKLEYSTRLFKRETIERFTRYFRKVLTDILPDPGIRLSHIDILDTGEKEAILTMSCSEKEAMGPMSANTLHHLFERQVERTPDKIALIGRSGPEFLTYRRLNRQANRLARLLLEKGVKPGQIVGLMVERSIEMVVALLAVMKTGGAYLPIDPGYPEQRVSAILADSSVSILLTGGSLLDRFTEGCCHVSWRQKVCLDELSGKMENYSGENPGVITGGSDAVYVIYTSGSTGQPKGVMVEHRNIVNLLKYQFKYTNLETSRVLQFATISFDASIHEMFSALLSGGRLYLIEKELRGDVPGLFVFIEKNGISTVFLPIQFLKMVFSEAEYIKRIPRSIRHIQTAGEQVVIGEKFREYLQQGHIYLHNHYGPSETHVVTTFTVEPRGNIPELPPIGRPLANTEIYILDKGGALTPVGVVGELYIAGMQVGRGYLNNPESTFDRFIYNTGIPGRASHFRGKNDYPGSPLYRTGDLARWQPEGNIEFLGRIDHQVKIRGYRIELGEIESQIINHELIDEAVVLAREREEEKGEKYLCAYVVLTAGSAEAGESLVSSQLRESLSGILPDYMVPAYFVIVEKIPVTLSGKVDRRALPLPVLTTGMGFQPPVTGTQIELVELWSEVLGIKKELIGIDTNFFQMGGHSLKATILTTRIHRAFDVKLPLTRVFQTPTVSGLSRFIDNAVKEKFTEIYPVEKREYYPVSSAQKRLYILHQMNPGKTVYNLPEVIPLQGEPDKTRLKETFTGLINRHESLRTSFHMIKEEPVQLIHETVAFELDFHHIQDYADFINLFVRPFDLSSSPLLRVNLLHLENSVDHILVVDIHHIISDGVTHEVLVRDFMEFYAGKELPFLRIQYKDYAQWQYKEKPGSQKIYWLKEMSGELPVIDLPLDYPRPQVWNFEGSTYEFNLSAEQTQSLHALALTSDTTLYMVLLAIYNLMLAKLSGQQDIIVGTTVAGRRHADLEKIIGMFVNTQAIRSFPTGEQGFLEYLLQLKHTTLQAFDNQEYPFEDLVEQVVVNRETSRNPIFDIMFTLQNMGLTGGSEPVVEDNRGLLTRSDRRAFKIEQRTAKFDLSLVCLEVEGQLVFCFEYSTALFKRETIERFGVFYKQLAALIIENHRLTIAQLEIITPEEKRMVLFELNDTAASYPLDKSVHGLLEEQVRQAPDHVALIWEADSGDLCISVTYRELQRRWDALAVILRERGVGSDSVTALLVGRSIEMVVGILGILKAGGAYLPIDPDYPAGRIHYILADSNAGVLVTVSSLENDMKNNHRCIFIDTVMDTVEASEVSTSQLLNFSTSRPSLPADAAYIIYTSGTTGRPRGVIIEHRHVVRLLINNRFQFDFNWRDIWTMFHSYCFDFSVWEMYGALLYGGKLIIIPKLAARDTGRYREILVKQAVTVLNQTPSAFYALMILEQGEVATDMRFRYVIFGGEALDPGRLKWWHGRYPRTKLINMYGITETTVHVTYKKIGNKEITSALSNIGRAIPTLSTYIMDQNLGILPGGIPGEICVGGEGVGRGYLNKPTLTRERFLKNPYKKEEKLYRSGDLGRLLENGEIEYLGRLDQQVKVRGYRIELGEIENQILAYSGIESAVVVSRADSAGDNHIYAYIVGSAFRAEADTEPLREWLSRVLPEYMLPLGIIPLEKIPLTVNGKVDRKQLPEPVSGNVNREREYTAARTENQEKLVEIWREVLDPMGREELRIGIDDNFFRLGGHSLRAAVMTALIRKAFSVDVSLIDVFTNPTIRGLAEIISRSRSRIGEPKARAIRPVEDREYYALSAAQQRLWIIRQLDRESTAYNVPVGVELVGDVDLGWLQETFNRLSGRHESMRTSFITVDQRPVQRVHSEVDLVVEYYDESGGQSLSFVSRGDMTAGGVEGILKGFVRFFDLSRAPLVRVCLIKTGSNHYLLMLDIHHIITDGTSAAVLQRDFMTYYNGGNPSPLELRYRDFSVWQNSEKFSRRVGEQETYWLNEFSGPIPRLNLPIDFPRPQVQEFKGKMYDLVLTGEEKRALTRLALEEEATLFMVLAAIFSVLLFRINRGDGEQEALGIVMGVPIAGRHADSGLQSVLGMFVNTLALRTEPGEEKTFRQFLEEVKERTLMAYENQDYQFDDLVDRLGLRREASRNPLFDVMIVLQNVERPEIDIPGLRLRSLPIDSDIAYFDICLIMMELEDRLVVSFNYNTSLFKPSTIERFAAYFREMVSSVTRERTVLLKDINISHRLITPDAGVFAGEISEENEEAFAF